MSTSEYAVARFLQGFTGVHEQGRGRRRSSFRPTLYPFGDTDGVPVPIPEFLGPWTIAANLPWEVGALNSLGSLDGSGLFTGASWRRGVLGQRRDRVCGLADDSLVGHVAMMPALKRRSRWQAFIKFDSLGTARFAEW